MTENSKSDPEIQSFHGSMGNESQDTRLTLITRTTPNDYDMDSTNIFDGISVGSWENDHAKNVCNFMRSNSSLVVASRFAQ